MEKVVYNNYNCQITNQGNVSNIQTVMLLERLVEQQQQELIFLRQLLKDMALNKEEPPE